MPPAFSIRIKPTFRCAEFLGGAETRVIESDQNQALNVIVPFVSSGLLKLLRTSESPLPAPANSNTHPFSDMTQAVAGILVSTVSLTPSVSRAVNPVAPSGPCQLNERSFHKPGFSAFVAFRALVACVARGP